MPEIVILPYVFEDARSDGDRRFAERYSLDEGVDGRRLAFLLPNMGPAAEKRHQLPRQRLPLLLRHVRPDSREKSDPQSLGQIDGGVGQLGGGLKEVDGLDGSRNVEKLGLAREEVDEALLGVEDDRLLGAGCGSSHRRIQRILLREIRRSGGKRIAVLRIHQSVIESVRSKG